jgi:hypothetical protein
MKVGNRCFFITNFKALLKCVPVLSRAVFEVGKGEHFIVDFHTLELEVGVCCMIIAANQ